MTSMRLAARAISATRSKRVSPATSTLSKPSVASSFFDSSFCTNITSNDSSACRHMPP